MEAATAGSGAWPPATNGQSIDALFEQVRELRAQMGAIEARVTELGRISEKLAQRLAEAGGDR